MLAGALLLAGTLASGWLHGKMANRWGQDAALKQAGGKLRQGLPAQLGPWRLLKTHKPDQKVIDILQSVAYLHGVYANDQTGDNISVALVAGPSGPISVHSPEICFSANDYEIAGEREKFSIADASGQKHSLWQLLANSREANRPNRRVLFAWSDGTAWQATRRPRFAFAGLPLLYKIQLSVPRRDYAADDSPDTSHEFLSRFLAEVQPRLITTSRLSSLSH
jgi:hypothetical protein